MSKCKENRIIHSAEEKAKEANRFLGHKVSLNWTALLSHPQGGQSKSEPLERPWELQGGIESEE